MSGDPMLRGKGEALGLSPFMAALNGRTRAVSEPLPFPGELGGGGLRFCLRVLSDDEVAAARSQALLFVQRYFRALDKDTPAELYMAADPGMFGDELERQVLARAMRTVDNPNAPLADASELRLWLDANTRSALMAAYNDHKDARSPLRKVRTPEELNELVAVLGEPRASSAFLSYCEPDTLRSIARELAARLIASTRPSCSSSGEQTSP